MSLKGEKRGRFGSTYDNDESLNRGEEKVGRFGETR